MTINLAQLKRVSLGFLKVVWLGAIAVVVLYYISRNHAELAQAWAVVSKSNIMAAFVMLFLTKLAISVLLHESVKQHGHRIGYSEAFLLYNATQLPKYLPGAVWHFVGRAFAYKKMGMTLKSAGKALAKENFWLAFGAVVVFMLGVTLDILRDSKAVWANVYGVVIDNIPFPAVTAAIVLLFLVVVFAMLKWRALLSVTKFLLPNIRILFFVLAIHSLLGVSLYVLIGEFAELPLTTVIAAHSIATFLGYLSFFAPAGIGVKEIVLLTAFGFSMDQHEIALVVGLHRIVYLLTDLLLGGASLIIGASLWRENTSKNANL